MPAQPTSGSSGPGSHLKVLVVDDDEDGAEMLGQVLELEGYDTRVAHGAEEALAIAAEFLPHIALLDLGLPVIDGFTLAHRVRALPGLGTIRLIAVTGYGRAEDRLGTLQAGFAAHLLKPIEPAQLLAAVRDDI
jgi:CheY-like chemotaxis protein